MRLWLIHPKYLDSIGLVALWRESLLAKKVLEGKTKGYKKHPELNKFKGKNQIKLINSFLLEIFKESEKRGYSFNKNKIGNELTKQKKMIPKKEIEFEFQHLKNKLKKRNLKKLIELAKIKKIELNPIFIQKK